MVSSTPAVSVIMPVYMPDSRFLGEAVRSVLGQSLQDLELIIVEDPSDRPARLPAGLSDPRARHVVNPRRTSHVAQINNALGLARAPFVAHLDADDVCEPHRLRVQYEYLSSRSDIDVLGSYLAIIDSAGRRGGYRLYPLEHESILAAMPRFNPLAHSSVMYRKDVVESAGGYREIVYPAIDYELWSRLAKRGVRFANHPEALVRYRLHGEGIKRTRLRSSLRATREVKRIYWLNSMGPRDRLRLWAEGALGVLPSEVVLRLFARWQFRTRLPVRESR